LAGQNQDYLAHALKAYQRGADGPNGRGNAIMGAQAKALNDNDIENIAAYLHTLPGTLVLKK
uniref:c-type cytochrome n=1 Tax=Undibacterium sp. TaxID=1914977 RepID=UPI00374CB728